MVGCTHGYFALGKFPADRCPCCGARYTYNNNYAALYRLPSSYCSNTSTATAKFKEASAAALMFLQDLDLCAVSLADLFCHWLPPPAQLHMRRFRRAARTRQPRRFSRYRFRRL